MSASHEWTEWHLTPRGWEAGSTRLDFQDVVEKEPPIDRVMTCRYTEYMGSAFSRMQKSVDIRWESDNTALKEELLSEYGDCPRR